MGSFELDSLVSRRNNLLLVWLVGGLKCGEGTSIPSLEAGCVHSAVLRGRGHKLGATLTLSLHCTSQGWISQLLSSQLWLEPQASHLALVGREELHSRRGTCTEATVAWGVGTGAGGWGV
jgi:hypothetical protein